MLDRDLIEPHVQFFGQQRGLAGIGALPHFDARHHQLHAAVPVHPHESVGRKLRMIGIEACVLGKSPDMTRPAKRYERHHQAAALEPFAPLRVLQSGLFLRAINTKRHGEVSTVRREWNRTMLRRWFAEA